MKPMPMRVVVDDTPPRIIPNSIQWPKRMYAIAFDLDTDVLRTTYHNASWQNAYEDIRRVLTRYDFTRQQGSVYFGDADKVDPVRCVLAVQDLTRTYAWFAGAVSDIRMLRIEENNDLMPAIDNMRQAILTQAAQSQALAVLPTSTVDE
jgi:virulence-associated protein VapD